MSFDIDIDIDGLSYLPTVKQQDEHGNYAIGVPTARKVVSLSGNSINGEREAVITGERSDCPPGWCISFGQAHSLRAMYLLLGLSPGHRYQFSLDPVDSSGQPFESGHDLNKAKTVFTVSVSFPLMDPQDLTKLVIYRHTHHAAALAALTPARQRLSPYCNQMVC